MWETYLKVVVAPFVGVWEILIAPGTDKPGLVIDSDYEMKSGRVAVAWHQDYPVVLRERRLFWWLVIFGVLLVWEPHVIGWWIIGVLIGIIIFRWLMRRTKIFAWGQKPILRKFEAHAILVEAAVRTPLYLTWWYNGPGLKLTQGEVLYENVESFEIGTYEEWFGALGTPSPLMRDVFVILLHAKEGKPHLIAAHAGPRVEVVELHSKLNEVFIASKARLLIHQTKAGIVPAAPIKL